MNRTMERQTRTDGFTRRPVPSAAIVGAVLGSLWYAGGAGTGSLEGIVRTSTGQPVRAAVTLHDLSTPRVAGQTPFDRQFASKSDGSFLIAGIPPGQYEICIAAPQQAVLDPCTWSPATQSVTVTDGGSITSLAVTVQTGTVLHVRVNDPEGLLSRTGQAANEGAISLGLIARRNRYLNLRMLSSDATGQDYFVVVPFEESLTLAVRSSTHALSDENFVPYLANSKRIPVRIAQGTIPAPVVVNVAHR